MGKVIPFIKIKKADTREEWLEQRLCGVGGSEAGAILGVNKYKSPVEVYFEKTGKSQGKDLSDNDFVHFGNVLEDVVADEFMRRNGVFVKRNNFILKSKDFPFMLANLDREGVDTDGKRFVLEIKTSDARMFKDWESGEIPLSYIAQVQHYLIVTGYDYGVIAVLIGGNRYRQFRIERDAEFEEILVDGIKTFWEEYVLKDVLPPVDGSESTSKVLKDIFPGYDEKAEIELHEEFEDVVKKRLRLKDDIKTLKKELEETEQLFRVAMGDNTHADMDNYSLTLKKTIRTGLDKVLLEANYPEIYSECLKKTSYRTLRIKEKKK